MSVTAELDKRATDRPDLAGRIEDCVIAILSERLSPGADVRGTLQESEPDLYDDGEQEGDEGSEPVGREFFQVRAMRGIENPPHTMIFQCQVEIIAHGQIRPSDVDEIETGVMSSARNLACLIRERAESCGIGLPSGWPVSFQDLQGQRSGVGNDQEVRWSFTIHAGAIEVSEAAA